MKHNVFLVAVIIYSIVFMSGCMKIKKKTDSPAEVNQSQIIEEPLKDMHISGEYSFSEDTELNLNTLYIDDKSTVFLKNFNVKIHLKNLIISGSAQIKNFKEDDKSPAGVMGLNGGALELYSVTASGSLKITLSGQSGSDGKNGYANISYSFANPGTGFIDNYYNGKPADIVNDRTIDCHAGSGQNAGDASEVFVKIDEANDFKLFYENREAIGGKIGGLLRYSDYLTIKQVRPDLFNALNKDCKILPQIGKNGKKGIFCTKFSTDVSYNCRQ